eukprot:scaffold85_cov358-Pavlova_lutheri.AAC.25
MSWMRILTLAATLVLLTWITPTESREARSFRPGTRGDTARTGVSTSDWASESAPTTKLRKLLDDEHDDDSPTVHHNCTCEQHEEDEHGHDDHDHDHDHDHDEEDSADEFLCSCPDSSGNEAALELSCSTKSVHEDEDKHDEEEDGAVRTLKIVGIVVLFVEVFFFALVPLFLRKKFESIEHWLVLGHAFSGGVFIAAGLTHILPEAVESSASLDIGHYPLAFTMVVFGYYMIYLCEGVFIGRIDALLDSMDQATDSESARNGHVKDHEGDGDLKAMKTRNSAAKPSAKYFAAFMFLLALGLHAFFAGLGLGLAQNNSDAIALLIANIAHKAFEAFAVSITIQRHGFSTRFMVLYFLLFALIAPAGVGVGWAIGSSNDAVFTVLLGLSAGTFLYMGATEVPLELLHEDMNREISTGPEERRTPNQLFIQRFLCFGFSLAGFLMIAALNFLDHGHAHDH